MNSMAAALLLRATALLFAAGAAAYLLRRSSAAVRHGLWAVTLAGLIVLPAAVVLLPRWEWPILAGPPFEGVPAPSVAEKVPSDVVIAEWPASTAAKAGEGSVVVTATPVFPVAWLAVLWLTGAGLGLAHIAVGLVVVQRLARRARPIEGGPWMAAVDEAAAELRLTEPVSVRESDAITVPVVYGLWRPAVLVPASARTWPAERRRVVMLHELAHVRRRDGLVQMIGNLARALYWPHPLVWFAQQRLKAEAERAADDCVIAAGTCGADYARLLLDVARALGRAPQPLVVVAVVERSSLADRLMALVDPLVRRHTIGRRLKVGGTLAAASVVAALAVAHPVAQTARAQAAPEPALATGPSTTASPARPRRRFTLPAEEAAALEKKLETDPNDLAARASLLSHYFLDRTPEGRAARARHALWVIEHAPESEIAGSHEVDLDTWLEPDRYEQGRALWIRHLDADGDNPEIVYNAANFFLLYDRERSMSLYKHGAELEPKDVRWRQRIAHLYSMNASRSQSTPDTQDSKSALENYEAALKLGDAEDRLSTLADASEAALNAGDTDKAREYARQVVDGAESLRGTWNYGNAIHDGHRILGHVALREGDVDAARTHLLESAKTPGSPQLNSFGPELTLARDLLAKGERDAVIQYLQSLRTFWKGSDAAIDNWIVLIRGGRTPDLHRFHAKRSLPK